MDRVERLDWAGISAALDAQGYATIPGLIDAEEAGALVALYDEDERFRNRVIMAPRGYGEGEYRYFSYPLPALVSGLREAMYPPLAAIANRWQQRLGTEHVYPTDHAGYLARCHAAGQRRPTPLMLRYRAGDFNCLHQDLYGELVFPLQLAILLARPRVDFDGGEFVLTEQRPRRQSRVEVVPLAQGDAVVFAVRDRPVQGARGVSRANLRHGVSRVRAGLRHTLGIIFHDAT